jgi:hypothetical protein
MTILRGRSHFCNRAGALGVSPSASDPDADVRRPLPAALKLAREAPDRPVLPIKIEFVITVFWHHQARSMVLCSRAASRRYVPGTDVLVV